MNLAWKKGTKYYQLALENTLFPGVIAVRCGWGRHGTHLGGNKTILCNNMNEAQMVIEFLKKRRKARGYELI